MGGDGEGKESVNGLFSPGAVGGGAGGGTFEAKQSSLKLG